MLRTITLHICRYFQTLLCCITFVTHVKIKPNKFIRHGNVSNFQKCLNLVAFFLLLLLKISDVKPTLISSMSKLSQSHMKTCIMPSRYIFYFVKHMNQTLFEIGYVQFHYSIHLLSILKLLGPFLGHFCRIIRNV